MAEGSFWAFIDPNDPTKLKVPSDCWPQAYPVFTLTCSGSLERLPDQVSP